jgi:hypothetical protein
MRIDTVHLVRLDLSALMVCAAGAQPDLTGILDRASCEATAW